MNNKYLTQQSRHPTQHGKVAVLYGGSSAERDISIQSGTAVLGALLKSGVDAHPFDPSEQGVHKLLENGFQRAFIVLHGRLGEDGTIQGALELMGMPYTGSGVLASALAMDKWRSKLVWQAVGLPTPGYELLDVNSDLVVVTEKLNLPLFVKPVNEGSSVGISKVKKLSELRPAYVEAAKYDQLVMAEEFVSGGEYTVAILGKQALPVIKIESAKEFYDFEAKYLRNDTRYLCPSGLSQEKEVEMQRLALKSFALIGGSGWGRVDFLMDEANRPYLLEINTVPGMTDHSLVPMAARQAGMSFEQLVLNILDLSHVE
jgi:D-alanine-D-alanine ligase